MRDLGRRAFRRSYGFPTNLGFGQYGNIGARLGNSPGLQLVIGTPLRNQLKDSQHAR